VCVDLSFGQIPEDHRRGGGLTGGEIRSWFFGGANGTFLNSMKKVDSRENKEEEGQGSQEEVQ